LTAASPGSSAALFKFMPRFKAQTEGSVVYYSHTVVLESVRQRGMALHASGAPYSATPDAGDAQLPKCLQTGPTVEVNLSPAAAAFTVAKYARPAAKQQGDLQTRSFFRLWHSQSECFVQASCNPEKDREHPLGRDSGEPAHGPYLKKLPDLGEDPDPSDPTNHFPKVKNYPPLNLHFISVHVPTLQNQPAACATLCQAVWCFEPLRRVTAGPVAWDAPLRVRHAASGRYLAVNTSAAVKADEGGLMERWFATALVDDEAKEDDDDVAPRGPVQT
jgi:hypothetical protein